MSEWLWCYGFGGGGGVSVVGEVSVVLGFVGL